MGGTSSQVCWKERADSDDKLTEALRAIGYQIKELNSQKFNPDKGTVSGIRDYKLSYFARPGGDWKFLLLHLNADFGEALAEELSRVGKTSAVVFTEVNRTAWGYALYQNGRHMDRFWNVPEAVGEQPSVCEGSANVLAKALDTTAAKIAPYLKHWSVTDRHVGKAFPEDEFDLSDHWCRVDFMRRLGIRYPDPGRGKDGKYLLVQDQGRMEGGKREMAGGAGDEKRPWWKFWSS